MDDFSDLFVGAYATSPTLDNWDKEKETKYIQAIKQQLNPIAGLELPFLDDCIYNKNDDTYFLNLFDKNWKYVLTCLPGNMKQLSLNPHFGLASDNEKGRLEALKFYKKACSFIKKINKHFKSKKVISVVIATSPSLKHKDTSSSTIQLQKSLLEIVKLDWDNAKLNIEHCDSGRKSNSVKGFLSLKEEIEAILYINKQHNADIAMTINWARSTLEHRNATGAIMHIRETIKFGILRGLMFSGTSDRKSEYGIWSDLHLPISKEENIEYFEETSLLSKKNIYDCFIELKDTKLSYLGIKVLSMPIKTSSMEQRIGINRDTMKILNIAREEANKNKGAINDK